MPLMKQSTMWFHLRTTCFIVTSIEFDKFASGVTKKCVRIKLVQISSCLMAGHERFHANPNFVVFDIYFFICLFEGPNKINYSFAGYKRTTTLLPHALLEITLDWIFSCDIMVL